METRSQAKRKVRDANIIKIWGAEWKGNVGTKTILCESIAERCDTSLSTVNRVIADHLLTQRILKS